MASNYWIKLYIEILDDPKMGMMPDWLFRRTIELFLVAGENRDGGKLGPVTNLAWRLRVPEADLVRSLRALEEIGIVHEAENDQWVVTHFEERQDAFTPAEKQKNYRERQHRKEYYGETNPVTKSVTIGNTDTDTESDPESDPEEDNIYHQPHYLLNVAIEKALGIPANNLPRWNKAIAELLAKGIAPEDISEMVKQVPKDFAITGPWSLAGGVSSIFLERKNGVRKNSGARVNGLDLALQKASEHGKSS